MAENLSNKAVEDAAIAWVIEVERAAGRVATDTRHRGADADLVSDCRIIEVEAYGGSARGTDLWLEERQVEVAETDPSFWLCVVENVRQGDPTLFRLVMIGGDHLVRLLARKKPQRTYLLPLPVADYDAEPPTLVVRDGPSA
jgi:hypothetical protein